MSAEIHYPGRDEKTASIFLARQYSRTSQRHSSRMRHLPNQQITVDCLLQMDDESLRPHLVEGRMLADVERQMILASLKKFGGNKTLAATELGRDSTHDYQQTQTLPRSRLPSGLGKENSAMTQNNLRLNRRDRRSASIPKSFPVERKQFQSLNERFFQCI